MLFPIDLNTRPCGVFKLLNDALLYFFEQSINAESFSHILFPLGKNDVCWDNVPTKDKFKAVWDKLPRTHAARQHLFENINNNQNLAEFFDDDAISLPEIADKQLNKVLQELTSHLYTSTKDRSKAKSQSGDCIQRHYQDFLRLNGSVCLLCGTELLSQNRADVNEDDQWRADYDHLLCKSEYPFFGVHPANFIPTCHTCNSKAKGKRKLLTTSSHERRKAFYPYRENEYCKDHISVTPHFTGIDEYKQAQHDGAIIDLEIGYIVNDNSVRQKIEVWEEVYQVPSRVKGNVLSSFEKRIWSDLRPRDNNFDDFCSQLSRHASLPDDLDKTEWRFWWFKLYEWLNQQADSIKRNVWAIIEWNRRQVEPSEFFQEFGI